jgi:hypothetical protein
MNLEKFHNLLLKKIRRTVGKNNSILHLSSKQEEISQLVSAHQNHLSKLTSLDYDARAHLVNPQLNKSFKYIIIDLDLELFDDLESFLKQAREFLIEDGLIIIIAQDLCTDINKLKLVFDQEPKNFTRPLRQVPANWLRKTVLEAGYCLESRLWKYDPHLILIASPHKYT